MKLFLFLISIIEIVNGLVFKQTLNKIESKRSKLIKAGKWVEYLEYKESLRNQKKGHVLPSIHGVLTDYGDLQYTANISVGTPEQHFVVALDTSSANFFIPDSSCNEKGPHKCPFYCSLPVVNKFFCNSACFTPVENLNSICSEKHMFHSTSSSTYTKKGDGFLIGYEFGNVEGFIGNDKVTLIGCNSKLAIPYTSFGQAQIFPPEFANTPIDGIFGMAFQSIAVDGITPPIINAINQDLLNKPIFTVYLQHTDKPFVERGGVVTYGDIDSENCGPIIAYQQLSSPTFWQFKVDSIYMKRSYFKKGYQVISDTSTSLLTLPHAIAATFASVVKAKYDPTSGIYSVECGSIIPDMNLVIGGKTYTIPYQNLIIDIGFENEICMFAITTSDFGLGAQVILGDPFIQSYCNIYDVDKQRIGFALAK